MALLNVGEDSTSLWPLLSVPKSHLSHGTPPLPLDTNLISSWGHTRAEKGIFEQSVTLGMVSFPKFAFLWIWHTVVFGAQGHQEYIDGFSSQFVSPTLLLAVPWGLQSLSSSGCPELTQKEECRDIGRDIIHYRTSSLILPFILGWRTETEKGVLVSLVNLF